MSKSLASLESTLPRITEYDLRRFDSAIEVRDAPAFALQLQSFVQERLQALREPGQKAKDALQKRLAAKAAELRSAVRWQPLESDIQRGRELLLKVFAQPHNLPLAEFARLAHKSRQQIYKDIAARKLLALNLGRRGQKLPDWQLDPICQELTQSLLKQAESVDNWTLYQALCEPLESLGGRSPVQAVNRATFAAVHQYVLDRLGIY